MSTFGGLILTNRGRNLQSKAQAGITLQYTRIGVGDGHLGSTSILDLNNLVNEVMSLDITKLKVLGDGRAVIGTVLSNQNMTEGFYFREIGLFAEDPDLGEVLYCYGNAGELAEYISAGGGTDIIEKSIDIQTIVGNAENISAVINESLVYATKEDLENIEIPVTSVNNKTGDVKLTAEDVGAETPDGAQAKVNALAGEGNTKTVKDLDEEIAAHKADNFHHIPYVIATGTNSYAVNIQGITALTEGMSVKVKFTNANTGASTLNINGLGAKPIRKSNGNALSSGNIKAGQICHLVYTGSVFQLLGEGGEYGTAQPNHVLEGITFGTEEGIITGTMPNRGAINNIITTQGGQIVIPEGYHNGSGIVKAQFANLIASVIKKGVNVGGIVGTYAPENEIKIGFSQSSTLTVNGEVIVAIGILSAPRKNDGGMGEIGVGYCVYPDTSTEFFQNPNYPSLSDFSGIISIINNRTTVQLVANWGNNTTNQRSAVIAIYL